MDAAVRRPGPGHGHAGEHGIHPVGTDIEIGLDQHDPGDLDPDRVDRVVDMAKRVLVGAPDGDPVPVAIGLRVAQIKLVDIGHGRSPPAAASPSLEHDAMTPVQGAGSHDDPIGACSNARAGLPSVSGLVQSPRLTQPFLNLAVIDLVMVHAILGVRPPAGRKRKSVVRLTGRAGIGSPP
jgi:hypothetical protein